MAQLSDYLEGELIKHLLRTGSMTKPTTVSVALVTTVPSDSTTGATLAEPSGGSYARVTVNPSDTNWSAPTAGNGASQNVNSIDFPVATASWGNIVGVALVDSASVGAGNVLLHAALPVPRTVNSGDQLRFLPNTLTVIFA